MKNAVLIFLTLFFSGVSGFSVPNVQSVKAYENPLVNSINRLPARATSISYGNFKEALNANRKKSSRVQSLNGNWDFKFSPTAEGAPDDFYLPDLNVSDWDKLPVPANWEMHGFGTAIPWAG